MITQVSPAGSGMGMEGGMAGSSMMGSAGMSAPSGGAPSEGATTYPGGSSSSGSAGMSSGPGGMGGTSAPVDPAFGRYVDDKYAVLDPAKLRTAHSSNSKEDALLAVAKRMPVRMRFRIDQRKMSKMLAECGNSKLPVEVRQVRLNRPAATVGGNSGGYGGSSGYGGSGGYGSGSSDSSGYGSEMPGSEYGSSSSSGYSSSSSGYGGYGGYGGMSGAMPGSGYTGGSAAGAAAPRAVGGASSTATVDYNLVDVEVYGIVYIYNPVNKAQLGLEPAGTASAAPPAITPTPAASPAPPATSAPATPPAAIVPSAGAE